MLVEGPVSLRITNISHDLALYLNSVYVAMEPGNVIHHFQRLSRGGVEWLLGEPTYNICYHLMSYKDFPPDEYCRWQSLLCTMGKKCQILTFLVAFTAGTLALDLSSISLGCLHSSFNCEQ